jgi:hypothetical protein
MSDEAPESPEPKPVPMSLPVVMLVGALVVLPPLSMMFYLGGMSLLGKVMMVVGGIMFLCGYAPIAARFRRRRGLGVYILYGGTSEPRPISPLAILSMFCGAPLFVMGLLLLQSLE